MGGLAGDPNGAHYYNRGRARDHIKYLKRVGIVFPCDGPGCQGANQTHHLISDDGMMGAVRCKACKTESTIQMNKARRLSQAAKRFVSDQDKPEPMLVSEVLELLSYVNKKAKRLKLPSSFQIEWPAFAGCIKEALLAPSSCESIEDMPADQAITEEASAIVDAVKGWLCSQHHQFDTRFSE